MPKGYLMDFMGVSENAGAFRDTLAARRCWRSSGLSAESFGTYIEWIGVHPEEPQRAASLLADAGGHRV